MNISQVRQSYENLVNRNVIFSYIVKTFLDIFFFSIRKINKLFTNDEGNVVVIALHRLGDTIFTIPAIREIQKFYKKKVIIVCFPESVPIYNLAFNNIEYCTVEKEDFLLGIRIAKLKVRKKINSCKPQIIIDLIGGMSSASIIFTSRAKVIVGMNKDFFKGIYDKFTNIRENPQLIDIYLDAISTDIQLQDRTELKKLPESYNRDGIILIHPFAGWKEKEWNLLKFIKLAEKLINNYHVGLITPAGQLSSDIISEIKSKHIEVIQTSSIEELIQNINECSIFIGNDSGPVNIANFIGRPTFTIYGATNPEFTASLSDHQKYIQKVLNCSARHGEKFCIIEGAIYSCQGIQCMNYLTLDKVYDSLIPLIGKYCKRR